MKSRSIHAVGAALFIYFIIVSVCMRDVQALRLFVSEENGTDETDCNSVMPCKTIAYAMTLIPTNEFGSEILLLPGLYQQQGNIGVVITSKSLTIRADNKENQPIFDCTNLPPQTACFSFRTSETLSMNSITFTGLVDYPIIEVVNGTKRLTLSSCRFENITTHEVRPTFASIVSHSLETTMLTVSGCVFDHISIPAIRLNEGIATITHSEFTNCNGHVDVAMVELGEGPPTINAINVANCEFRGNTHWYSLVSYAPLAFRGTLYLSDSVFYDNRVEGPLVHLRGAAMFFERGEFLNNTGSRSIVMERHDKKDSQMSQFSISMSNFSMTPSLSFYNATGALTQLMFNGTGIRDSAGPIVELIQPIRVTLTYSTFSNFSTVSGAQNPIVSIKMIDEDPNGFSDVYRAKIFNTTFHLIDGYTPVWISGQLKGWPLVVNITDTTFDFVGSDKANGGGIHISDSPLATVVMTDLRFHYSHAKRGGAVYCLNSLEDSDASRSLATTQRTLLQLQGNHTVFQNVRSADGSPAVLIDPVNPCRLECYDATARLCNSFHPVQDDGSTTGSGYGVASAVLGMMLIVGLLTVGCFVSGIAFVRSVNKEEGGTV